MLAKFRQDIEDYFFNNWTTTDIGFQSADSKPKDNFIQLFITPITGKSLSLSDNKSNIHDVQVRVLIYADTMWNVDNITDEIVAFIADYDMVYQTDYDFGLNGSMQANLWYQEVSFMFSLYNDCKKDIIVNTSAFSSAFNMKEFN